jgi:hypothetical protein
MNPAGGAKTRADGVALATGGASRTFASACGSGGAFGLESVFGMDGGSGVGAGGSGGGGCVCVE